MIPDYKTVRHADMLNGFMTRHASLYLVVRNGQKWSGICQKSFFLKISKQNIPE